MKGTPCVFVAAMKPASHASVGNRVRGYAAAAYLGTQRMSGIPGAPDGRELFFDVFARRDLDVAHDLGRDAGLIAHRDKRLRSVTGRAFEECRFGFARFDRDSIGARVRLHEPGKRSLWIGTVEHDAGRQRVRSVVERGVHFVQARSRHDEASQHPVRLAGFGACVRRERIGHRALRRRKQAGVVDQFSKEGTRRTHFD